MSSRAYTIDDVVAEDARDTVAAMDYLRRNDWTYHRTKFEYLKDAPLALWSFDKSHLKAFNNLVKEAGTMRKEFPAWREREKKWFGTSSSDLDSDKKIFASNKKRRKTKPKQTSDSKASAKQS